MRLRVLMLAFGLLVLAGSAWAQGGIQESNRWRHWDFSLQTRYIGATDYDGKGGSSLHINDDLGWGFGFGYHVNERVNIGFLMSWRAVPYDAKAVNENNETIRYSNWLDTGTFALTGEWNILPKTLTPYVNGAIGWTMLDTNVYAGYGGSYCWWDPWYGYICDDYAYTYGTDEATFAAGAGIRWEVARTVFLRAGYESNWITLDNTPRYDVFRFDVGLTY